MDNISSTYEIRVRAVEAARQGMAVADVALTSLNAFRTESVTTIHESPLLRY